VLQSVQRAEDGDGTTLLGSIERSQNKRSYFQTRVFFKHFFPRTVWLGGLAGRLGDSLEGGGVVVVISGVGD
jgi:hypothetical protein